MPSKSATTQEITLRNTKTRERSRPRGRTQEEAFEPILSAPKQRRSFHPRTDAQERYVEAIDASTITFAVGPAGTGKTYVAAAKAAEHLRAGEKTQVILTRPAVEAAGERLGFLPGRLDEKFGPYMKPLMKLLIEDLGTGFVTHAIKLGRIQMVPMAFMRGETFNDAFIIADEMQNATKEQLKMLLTRIGQGSKMVIDGDPTQNDLEGESGLHDATYRLKDIRNISVVRFDKSDVVRHSIIQEVIEAYEIGTPPR